MALSAGMAAVLGFLRAGYPEGSPGPDRVPLFALMRRRLTDDEVVAVARELAARSDAPVDGTSVGVAINRLTDEMPSPADTERVKRQLDLLGRT